MIRQFISKVSALSHGHRTIGTVGFNAKLDVDLPEKLDRKTKIVCTVGPSTWDKSGIKGLLNRGMNVLRLNFSHGTYQEKERVINDLRDVLAKIRKDGDWDFADGSREDLCAIAADTKGPEIRTGLFGSKNSRTVLLETGETITLSTNVRDREAGTAKRIWCDYESLPDEITIGQRIFIDDGLLSLIVNEVDSHERTISCTVENGGKLGEQKGINIPEPFKSNLPSLTEQDANDLAFAVENGVDIIFASFIRRREDIQAVREALGEKGKHIQVIAKIENKEGCDNFDSILEESDGIMVARGDLGIEIPPHTVFLAQKMMISKCNIVGKPVICATQMLESMVENPRPTRAECGDVANAVLDGADAVMLSGETAKGNYPFGAVEMMSAICKEAEVALDYDSLFDQMRGINSKTMIPSSFHKSIETVATSAVVASLEIEATAIVCFSYTGGMVRALAKYRPNCPIFCVTSSEQVGNSVLLNRGIIPLFIPEKDMLDLNKGMNTVMKELSDMQLFSSTDNSDGKLVVIGRFDVNRPHDPVMTLI